MNQKYNILLVEDDARIRSFMETVLTSNGYNVLETDKARTALSMAASHNPDLMLLDLGLSDMDGQQVIRSVREWSNMPIVVVSARGHESDKVTALDNGADDYVTKPFGMAELLARIRAALRKKTAPAEQEALLGCDDLTLDVKRHQVRRAGNEILLTGREFALLEHLLRNQTLVLTREQLLESVWGYDYTGETNIVDVYIRYLRSKMDEGYSHKLLHTVRGVGYTLCRKD